jgi:hypothetical protein
MDDAKSQSPPFYERRSFQGALAVVGLLTAVWALVGAPKPWSVAHDLTVTKLPLSNTEIVLDTSRAMMKPFDGHTKLDAAMDAVARFAASTNSSGLALRQTGGGCHDDGDVLVGFGAGHGDDVQEAAADVRPSGRSNVIGTVRGAIDEFTSEQFRDPSSIRRVVVFMGGEDECTETAGVEISDALDGLGVDTTFRMYALGMSHEEVKNMSRFKAELKSYAKVEVLPVENGRELEHAVQQEAEEISSGQVPDGANLAVPDAEEEEGADRPQAQGIDPEGLEETEPTETTPEPESPEVEPSEEETEVVPSEEAPPPEPAPSSSEIGTVPGSRTYVSAPPSLDYSRRFLVRISRLFTFASL